MDVGRFGLSDTFLIISINNTGVKKILQAVKQQGGAAGGSQAGVKKKGGEAAGGSSKGRKRGRGE